MRIDQATPLPSPLIRRQNCMERLHPLGSPHPEATRKKTKGWNVNGRKRWGEREAASTEVLVDRRVGSIIKNSRSVIHWRPTSIASSLLRPQKCTFDNIPCPATEIHRVNQGRGLMGADPPSTRCLVCSAHFRHIDYYCVTKMWNVNKNKFFLPPDVFFQAQLHQNPFLAGAPPPTPLWELMTFPQTHYSRLAGGHRLPSPRCTGLKVNIMVFRGRQFLFRHFCGVC